MKRALAALRKPRSRRTRGVTLLALGVLIMACLNLVRAILAIQQWDFLSQQPGVSPVYLLLTGMVWCMAGGWICWGLWLRKPWAPDQTRGLVLIFSLYAWLERFFLYDRLPGAGAFQPLLPGNWIFLLGLNLLVLIWVFWTLEKVQSAAKKQSEMNGEANE